MVPLDYPIPLHGVIFLLVEAAHGLLSASRIGARRHSALAPRIIALTPTCPTYVAIKSAANTPRSSEDCSY